MIKAVLFDLDDTLLDINFTAFMTRYVAGLSGLLGDISRAPAPLMGIPFTKAYLAIEDRDRSDDLTNHQLFINKVHGMIPQLQMPLTATSASLCQPCVEA